MVLVIESNPADRVQNIIATINEIYSRLNLLKEDVQFNPDKYDMDSLFDILSMIYDDIGDFQIGVATEWLFFISIIISNCTNIHSDTLLQCNNIN